MKKSLVVFFVAAFVLATFAVGHAQKVPGAFDSYVFSLSRQPAFCRLHPDKKECATQTPERYDARNPALHGLWPNKKGDTGHAYGFCGVPGSIRKLDKPASWCKMPAPALNDGTKKNLAVVMPGYASCLERHEWYKHGSCSAMEADKHFSTSVDLAKKFAGTGFSKYIASNTGKAVDSDALLAEFEKDFGPGSRKLVNLYCDRINGSDALVGMRTYLANPLPSGSLKDMLVSPDAFEKGNCPASFFISAASSRDTAKGALFAALPPVAPSRNRTACRLVVCL